MDRGAVDQLEEFADCGGLIITRGPIRLFAEIDSFHRKNSGVAENETARRQQAGDDVGGQALPGEPGDVAPARRRRGARDQLFRLLLRGWVTPPAACSARKRWASPPPGSPKIK